MAGSKRDGNLVSRSAARKFGKRMELSPRGHLAARAGTVEGGITASGGTASGSQVLCTQPGENCQDADGLDARSSDRLDFWVADDFRPAEDGSVSEICWRGAYYNFSGLQECSDIVTADSFEVKYYTDAGGVPGDLIGYFRQGGFEHPLEITGREATGNMIAGEAPEYEFTAVHAPFPVQAGECYWIEITNHMTTNNPAIDCLWLWETSSQADGWALQDDDPAGDPQHGYDVNDNVLEDFAFCLDTPMTDPSPCSVPAPANDHCAEAESISTVGVFPFENARADTDGFGHSECEILGTNQVSRDVWFCWTAPCTNRAFVSTCNQTELDTRIAVYQGCDVCPPTDANLVACNDDRCGGQLAPFQSLVALDAQAGQEYLIRVGVFPDTPGGAGAVQIGCGPREGMAGCPGLGSCCAQNSSPGCTDASCCSIVCACDPFCCDVSWVESCATIGWPGAPGCGSEVLCSDCTVCGDPQRGDCCTANASVPGCSDRTCCETVCEADSFCCEVEWDEACATTGADNSGNGAEVLCPELCGPGPCPSDPVTWLVPPDRLVDAREPNPPDDVSPEGIDTVLVRAPAGAERLECWDVCESSPNDPPNSIVGITVNADDTLTLQLDRPLMTNAVTTIRYAGNGSAIQFLTHPGNANGDTQTSTADVHAMIDYLSKTAEPRWGLFGGDIDHSGLIAPGDLLRLIDVLAGAETYEPGWMGTVRPSDGGTCP